MTGPGREKRIEISSAAGDRILCRLADSFWSRFMGLMGRRGLPKGEGLLIRPCNSIHMFFMKFSIDAAFMDRDFTIVRLIRNLAPGRVVGSVPGAWQVLETAAGDLPASYEEGTRLTADPA
jgi:uncharacterized membrane protein (UPF0127 family)